MQLELFIIPKLVCLKLEKFLYMESIFSFEKVAEGNLGQVLRWSCQVQFSLFSAQHQPEKLSFHLFIFYLFLFFILSFYLFFCRAPTRETFFLSSSPPSIDKGFIQKKIILLSVPHKYCTRASSENVVQFKYSRKEDTFLSCLEIDSSWMRRNCWW